jgi:hypothetical protein
MSGPREMRLRPRRKLLFPDELRPGDRVLVECEVFESPDAYPPGAHTYVRPVGMWQAGDQELWTWTRRMTSHPEPYIIPTEAH